MRKIITPIILIVVAAIFYYTISGSSEDYLTLLEKHRTEQNLFFKDADNSPFNEFNLGFKGLKYFPANPDYNVKAKIEQFEDRQIIELLTSTGQNEKYIKFGMAHFSIAEQAQQLTLLQPLDDQSQLFIAFTDATSANESYGAGRYIDIKYNNAKKILIDFNKAYNPYCAYVDEYSCPLPLPENNLNVAIEAGEKNYSNNSIEDKI